MITKFKIFENNNEPEIGDYVIGFSLYFSDKTINFLKKNIGKISSSKSNAYNNTKYNVQYENVPKDIINEDFYVFVPRIGTTYGNPEYYVYLHRSEINHFSKNKEDLEVYVNANKYNL